MEILLSQVKRVLVEDQSSNVRRIIVETSSGDVTINLLCSNKRVPVQRRKLED